MKKKEEEEGEGRREEKRNKGRLPYQVRGRAGGTPDFPQEV